MTTKQELQEAAVVVLDIRDWEVTKMALEELAHSAGSGSMALVCRQVIDSIRQQVNEQRI